ncbi:MAG: hydantoinase/oxoprolinase family protein [Deltaproteobacteria bacterium]|nr:hydantoinase/oxoprolinase family protein [Deltaproteobacteria bacterium]
MYKIGIDTGGTFTDCVLFDENSGTIKVVKLSSTPKNPALAALEGIKRLLTGYNIDSRDIGLLVHGTTVATNAVLEGRVARAGLITTKGFRDVLEIGTGQRPELYDLTVPKPDPLIPRPLRQEVTERISANGEIVQELDVEEVEAAVKRLIDEDVESIAISLLFAYTNGTHERSIKEIARRLAPKKYVCISSEICPEFREYPRTSTTVINACVAPIISDYLQNFKERLKDFDMAEKLHIMQSNGGIMNTKEAVQEFSHQILLSGPAGGVVGAAYVAKMAGFQDVITLDMGGTSTDVGVVLQGAPRMSPGTKMSGWYPMQAPITDIYTIGAGGGSIAWIDSGGMLRVGPKSAGAEPGPMCYRRGGTEPTITDANLVLGRLDSDSLLGGEMDIDKEASESGISKLGDRLNMSLIETASGIIEMANNNMVGALRVMTTGKGYDPRDFALVAFGGAGALHAASLAEEMGIPEVIVPVVPGVLSSFGLLASDIKHDHFITYIKQTEYIDIERMDRLFEEMEAKATARLLGEGISPEDQMILRSADLRYVGQAYYLNIPVPSEPLTRNNVDRIESDFHKRHQQIYGQSAPGESVEFVNLRVTSVGKVTRPEIRRDENKKVEGESAWMAKREVYFKEAGDFLETDIFDRGKLVPGMEIEGPAIIEQLDSTTVILPKQRAEVDPFRNIIIKTNRR